MLEYDVSLSLYTIIPGRAVVVVYFFFFQAEDGIRDLTVTGVQTCALPISAGVTGRLCRIPTLARLGIVRRLGPYRRFAYETMADGVVVNAAAIKQVLQKIGRASCRERV